MIRAFLNAVIVGGLLLLASIAVLVWPENIRRARADAATYVIGDSICEGITSVRPAPGYVRRGAMTYDLIGWLDALPHRSAVVFCAGTNDAAVQSKSLRYSVAAVLSIVRANKLRMTWIGPVRTTRPWDRHSNEADTFLALHLARAGARYVSLRAVKFERSELAGDGIHFTPKGYRRIARLAGVAP